MIDNQGGTGWHKSTYSSQGIECVEQGVAQEDGSAMVRDTKLRGTGPVLGFAPEAWASFVDSVR